MSSQFLYHESCPQCGSKDNLGVWDDGHKFCFGCKYYESGTITIHSVFNPQEPIEHKESDFPYDANEDIPAEALKWLLKYHITFQLQKEFGILWSNRRQMLCWKIYGVSGNLLGWQGRCFAKDAKTKYFSQGKIHEDLCILSREFPIPSTVVLVEDFISAIRVSEYLPCMPLWGCTCGLNALGELKKRFSTILVWLDGGKLDNARKIGLNASMVGLKSGVIYTSRDPKEYSSEEIDKFLQGE